MRDKEHWYQVLVQLIREDQINNLRGETQLYRIVDRNFNLKCPLFSGRERRLWENNTISLRKTIDI